MILKERRDQGMKMTCELFNFSECNAFLLKFMHVERTRQNIQDARMMSTRVKGVLIIDV